MNRTLLVIVAVVGGTLSCARGIGTRTGTVPELDGACQQLEPQADSGREVRRGQQAPDFELKDLTGKSWSLRALRGQPVLLNFWATWCEPCREEIPALAALARQSDRRLKVVAVNVDEDRGAARSFLSEATHLTVLLDPEKQVAKRYGATKFPETFLIDSDGRVQQLFYKAKWDGPAAEACLAGLR